MTSLSCWLSVWRFRTTRRAVGGMGRSPGSGGALEELLDGGVLPGRAPLLGGDAEAAELEGDPPQGEPLGLEPADGVEDLELARVLDQGDAVLGQVVAEGDSAGPLAAPLLGGQGRPGPGLDDQPLILGEGI